MKLDFVSTTRLSVEEEHVVKGRVVRLPFWSAVEEWAAAEKNRAERSMGIRAFGIVDTDIVGCHIVGREDSVMVALGRAMGLPRGFDVLFIPKGKQKGRSGTKGSAASKSLEDSEFRVVYGGFLPKFTNDDNSEAVQIPDDATRIDLSFKLSGSLIKLTFMAYEQRMLCLVSTKNAGLESRYVTSAITYLKEQAQLPGGVVEQLDGCCICGEFMDVDDQSHGSRVLRKAMVVTSVATSDPTKTKFFMDYASDRKLAARIGLRTVDELNIEISDMVKARALFKRLDENRDEMNMEGFISSEVEGMDGVTLSTLHKDILPDRLEGLVVHVHHGNGSKETFKYKFFSYTNVTMGVRSVYEQLQERKIELEQVPSMLASVLFRWAANPYSLVALKQYYAGIRAVQLLHEAEFEPSEHVLAYNAAINEWKHRDLDGVVESVDLYVVCGPIGGGKSSLAARLATQLGLRHIDGDELWPGFDAAVLKHVRNDFTISRIVEELAVRGATIISCGGGVLSTVREAVFVMLRRRLNIHLLAPTTGECSLSGIHDCWEVHHSDQGRFREVLAARQWKDAAAVEAHSRRNIVFAQQLFKRAVSVTYYSYSKENTLLNELPELVSPVSTSITCRQWRLFTTLDWEKVWTERHITVDHSARFGRPLTCTPLGVDFPRVVIGRKIKVFQSTAESADDDRKHSKAFVGQMIDLKGLDLGSSELPADLSERAHITLKCGRDYMPRVFAEVMLNPTAYEFIDEGEVEVKIWGEIYLR